MTSKATLLSLARLKLGGFIEYETPVPLAESEKKRRLFVSHDVLQLLSGQKNPAAMFPCVAADLTIGRFCKGYIASVTKKPTGKADFKHLSGHDEAWVMVFPGPGSGWRMFGRFARKNVFVGITCFERGDCSPFKKYNERAVDMIAQWETAFPGEAPLSGSKYEDYLGDMYRDDDA